MYIVTIAFPIKNLKNLLYKIKSKKKIKKGYRVIVQLKNKYIIGIILNIKKLKKIYIPYKIKNILYIIDKKELINKKLFNFLIKSSKYYNYPIGKIIINILNNIKKINKKKILNEKFKKYF